MNTAKKITHETDITPDAHNKVEAEKDLSFEPAYKKGYLACLKELRDQLGTEETNPTIANFIKQRSLNMGGESLEFPATNAHQEGSVQSTRDAQGRDVVQPQAARPSPLKQVKKDDNWKVK